MYQDMGRMKKACNSLVSIQPTQCPPCPIITCPKKPEVDASISRDRAANNDPLYPPLNRPSRRDQEDTFRFVGYLVNENDKDDAWKLFGREKNRHEAEFYVTSANKNIDMKIFITREMVVSPEKLRDLYTIPEYITINHPLMQAGTYRVVLNPSTDFSSQIYM